MVFRNSLLGPFCYSKFQFIMLNKQWNRVTVYWTFYTHLTSSWFIKLASLWLSWLGRWLWLVSCWTLQVQTLICPRLYQYHLPCTVSMCIRSLILSISPPQQPLTHLDQTEVAIWVPQANNIDTLLNIKTVFRTCSKLTLFKIVVSAARNQCRQP